MTRGENFDNALNAAIDALASGCSLRDVLEQHQQHAAALLPLLQAALASNAHARVAPPPAPARLGTNYSILHAAVERAQTAARKESIAARSATGAPWWQRRIAFASLTVPLGAVVAFAAVGIGGAAAAGVASSGDGPIGSASHIRSRVVDSVDAVNPFDSGHGDTNEASRPEPSSASGAAPAGTSQAQSSSTSPVRPTDASGTAEAHGRDNSTTGPHVADTVSGRITDIHGNTFTLTGGGGEWHVTIDGATRVVGAIANGAEASVRGAIAAGKNVHADTVSVIADTTTSSGTPPQAPVPAATGHGDDNTGDNSDRRNDGVPTNHRRDAVPTATKAPSPTAVVAQPPVGDGEPTKPVHGNDTGNGRGAGNDGSQSGNGDGRSDGADGGR